METEIEKIKTMIIKALFTDDDLMYQFVLKGGNALAIAYGLTERASTDVDVSIEADFDQDNDEILIKLKKSFERIFKDSGYIPFDFCLIEKPKKLPVEKASFWGGYSFEFKVSQVDKFDATNIELSRKQAMVLGVGNKKNFGVDISKFEYCSDKCLVELDGMMIFAYTPLMIVNEKLRAICQQMPEYKTLLSVSTSARPRDFFDIWNLFSKELVTYEDFYFEKNIENLKKVFELKKVPLELIKKIKETKEFHETDIKSLESTINFDFFENSFEVYFDFVVRLVENIKNL